MLRVALTGGIGTGKSYVVNRLRERHVACLDADALAHGVTVPGTEATAAIAARFGPDILDASGGVDRRKLGTIVFGDPAARRDLEAIVHPSVYRAISAALRALELTDAPAMACVDIPLLYETGRAADFDKVIATVCPRDMQIARLLERGLTRAEAEQRLAAQLPAAEKATRADYVIRTDGSFEETDRQVDDVLSKIANRRL